MRTTIIHAFGHALARTHDLQQGAAHAIVAPRVLRYLFDEVDARRQLLATALGVGDESDPASAVVDAVERVGDVLNLPSRLRDVDGPEPAAFPEVARATLDDSFMTNAPPGLDPSREELEGVLRDAY